jgi:hypothetical protein
MSEWKLPDDIVEPSIEGAGGGNFLWESGAYDANIKLAYLNQTAGGAYFLNVELEKSGEKFGRIKDKWCIKSGNEKGNKIFYIGKDGKKQPLPGYQTAKSLCITVTGEDLEANMAKLEKKVIKVWDFNQGKEVPSEHPVIPGLINKKVKVAVHQVIEDKKAKNSEGNWVSSGATKTTNQCKFFANPDNGKTAEEISANKDAGALDRWATKNTGLVVDKSTKTLPVDSAAEIMGNNSSPTQGSLFNNDAPQN